jgi:hypothetical protein
MSNKYDHEIDLRAAIGFGMGILACVLIGVLACALGGCSAPVAMRDEGPSVYGAGATSEVVFTAREVAESRLRSASSADLTRRDREMYARAPESALACSMWPEAPSPSLSSYRRVYLNTTSDSLIYFTPSRREYRSYDAWMTVGP